MDSNRIQYSDTQSTEKQKQHLRRSLGNTNPKRHTTPFPNHTTTLFHLFLQYQTIFLKQTNAYSSSLIERGAPQTLQSLPEKIHITFCMVSQSVKRKLSGRVYDVMKQVSVLPISSHVHPNIKVCDAIALRFSSLCVVTHTKRSAAYCICTL